MIDRPLIENVCVLVNAGVVIFPERYWGCLATWVPHFKNYVISGDSALPNDISHIVSTNVDDPDWVNHSYLSNPSKLFNGLKWIAENKSHCEWVLIVDDDTFVNDINFRKIIKQLDPKKRAAYGRLFAGCHYYNGHAVPFLQGGAGIIIPMFIVEEIAKKMTTEEWGWLVSPAGGTIWIDHPKTGKLMEGWADTPGNITYFQADLKLGYFMKHNGVEQVDLGALMRIGPEDGRCACRRWLFPHGGRHLSDILFRVTSHRHANPLDMCRLTVVLNNRGIESHIDFFKKIQF